MESVAALLGGDQRQLRSWGEREDRISELGISERRVEVGHAVSLFRHKVNGRRTMIDNDHYSASFARRRSVALIHSGLPSGPRTRPHHSKRSLTQ